METINEKNCNQCNNHCPVSALKCGKGRRYFDLQQEHAEDKKNYHEHGFKNEDGNRERKEGRHGHNF